MTGSPIGTADSIMLNALMHPSWVAEMALMSADMVRDNESFLRLISAYNLHSSCSRVVVISERVRRGEDIDVVMTSTPHDRATPAMNGLMYGLLIALLDFGRRTTNAQRSNYEWSVMCDVAAKVDSVDIPSALRAGVMFAEYGRAMHLPKRASISLLRKVERRMKPKGTITK